MGFEGEVFEMEDQRNWTDGSFKTYCTPLALPRPVWVEAGAVIEQSVRLSLTLSGPAETAAPESESIRVTLSDDPPRRLPRLGLALPTEPAILTPPVVERLRALRPAHLRAELALRGAGWEEELKRIADAAKSVGAPVEMALILGAGPERELEGLAAYAPLLPEIQSWLVFSEERLTTPPELIRAVGPLLRRLAPQALLGGGSQTHFAQLNRARPPGDVFDLLSYPISPQAHAMDDATLVEALAGQAATVRTARSFAGGARVAVSPVTLRPRGAGTARIAPADERQSTSFAAAWTAISVKYLAEGGADSVTYYEALGPRGVMSAEGETPTVYPVYETLTEIGLFSDGAAISCASSHPLQADALLLAKGTRRRLFAANFTGAALTVTLEPSALHRIPDALRDIRLAPRMVTLFDWET
jgi:hypothetical protein